MSFGDAPDSWATVTVPPLIGLPLAALPPPTCAVVPPQAASTLPRTRAAPAMASRRVEGMTGSLLFRSAIAVKRYLTELFGFWVYKHQDL
jgi:hypothetical protein